MLFDVNRYGHADDSDEGRLRIYMELIPDGSLLQNTAQMTSWDTLQLLTVAWEVASALEYFHNLKPAIARLDVQP